MDILRNKVNICNHVYVQPRAWFASAFCCLKMWNSWEVICRKADPRGPLKFTLSQVLGAIPHVTMVWYGFRRWTIMYLGCCLHNKPSYGGCLHNSLNHKVANHTLTCYTHPNLNCYLMVQSMCKIRKLDQLNQLVNVGGLTAHLPHYQKLPYYYILYCVRFLLISCFPLRHIH